MTYVRASAPAARRARRAPAGAIGAIVVAAGERGATTGDTLCAHDAPIRLDTVHVPEPVIGIAIEAATADEIARLRGALDRLAAEDPSFQVGVDPDTGATTIAGMGELHLEILVDRLRREFGIAAAVGRLQVAYRETITAAGRAEARHESTARGPADFEIGRASCRERV